MKKSIVLKWFTLIVLIFSIILLFIAFAQNYFFEQYYVKEKLNTLQTYTRNYLDLAESKGAEIASLEFYKNNHVWITELDQYLFM